MDKNCTNCHYFNFVGDILDCPCAGKGGCYYQEEYTNWKPMTYGDKIRRMPDRELAATMYAYKNLGRNVTLNDIFEHLGEEARE